MNISDFLHNHSLFKPQNKRLVRYLIVGAFGFIINQIVFIIAFSGMGISYVIAGLLGSWVSIFANYVMNDSWTWRESGAGGVIQWFWRGIKYGATRIVGIGIGTVAQIAFVEILLIEPLISNVLKVGVGVLWGFIASEKWVWKATESSSEKSTTSLSRED